MTEIKRFDMRGNTWPSDDGSIVSYKDHAAIVAAKDARIAELESAKMSVTENYLRVTEERNESLYKVIELQEQVRALAAEGSGIKQAFKQAANTVEEYEIYGDLKYGVEPSQYEALADAIEETPNTDAALREIRAQAVDDFGIYHNFSEKQLIQVEAKKYADRIRAGEQP